MLIVALARSGKLMKFASLVLRALPSHPITRAHLSQVSSASGTALTRHHCVHVDIKYKSITAFLLNSATKLNYLLKKGGVILE